MHVVEVGMEALHQLLALTAAHWPEVNILRKLTATSTQTSSVTVWYLGRGHIFIPRRDKVLQLPHNASLMEAPPAAVVVIVAVSLSIVVVAFSSIVMLLSIVLVVDVVIVVMVMDVVVMVDEVVVLVISSSVLAASDSMRLSVSHKMSCPMTCPSKNRPGKLTH